MHFLIYRLILSFFLVFRYLLHHTLLILLLRQLEKKLLGKNPLQIEAAWNNLKREDGERAYNTALSGIELGGVGSWGGGQKRA